MRYLKPVLSTTLLTLGVGGWVMGAQHDMPATPTSPSPQSGMPSAGGTAAAEGTAPASEAISLIGRDVLNREGERLGTVDTLLVTPEGQVDALILGSGGMLGIGKDRYEIPWEAVQLQNNGEQVVVDTTKERMASEFSAFEPKPEPEPEPPANQPSPLGGPTGAPQGAPQQ